MLFLFAPFLKKFCLLQTKNFVNFIMIYNFWEAICYIWGKSIEFIKKNCYKRGSKFFNISCIFY